MHDHLGYDELTSHYHILESLQQVGDLPASIEKEGIDADKQNELGPQQQAENASTQQCVERGEPLKRMTIWAMMN